MNEVALFLTFTLRNPRAGVGLAKAALALNPHSSSDLWNTLGDAYYEMGFVAEAKNAYRCALRVNSTDVKSRYNLAWTLIRQSNYREALEVIAEALALDETGEYCEALIKKQAEVLRRLAQRNQQRELLMANRVSKKPIGEQASEKYNKTETNIS